MKISEAFDLYKNNYMLIKGRGKRMLESHDHVKATLIQVLGDINIRKLSLDDVNHWVIKNKEYQLPDGTIKQKAANTIRNDIICLRVVLKYAQMTGHRCLNPALIPVPKREDVMRNFLSADEVTAMIENAYSLRNKVVISLLYSSGIRLSEMISLNRDSIKGKSFTVIGKGKKSRLCFIDDRTQDLITRYLRRRHDDCDALIVSYKNLARMTPTNVQMLVKNAARRAGIKKKVTPHVLRHSFATNFLQNDGNIRYLSTLLGHSSVDTTMIYTHTTNNDLRSQYERFHSI